MIRDNYILSTTEGIAKYLKDLELFLNNTPPGSDIEALFTYMNEMRGHYATLAHVSGIVEGMHSKAIASVIQNEPEETYKRIKQSSTLVTQYAESKEPNVAHIYHKCGFLKKALVSATSELTTQIAYRKEEMRMSVNKVSQK